MMSPPLTGGHLLAPTVSAAATCLTRVIFGARYALAIGFGAVLIGAIGGLIVGMAAALPAAS